MSTAGRPKAKKQRRLTFDESPPAGTAEMLEHFSVAGQFNWKLLCWVDVLRVNRKHAFVADEIRELRAAARRLRTAIAEKNWIAAERADAAANTTYLRMRLLYMGPLAQHGKKFPGRKVGSYAPIHKAIARLLKQRPIKNLQLWDTLKSRPPRGWTFFDNSQGKYIEGPKASDGMNYSRFRNIASEERKKLKG